VEDSHELRQQAKKQKTAKTQIQQAFVAQKRMKATV
jgi:hypothetical protein